MCLVPGGDLCLGVGQLLLEQVGLCADRIVLRLDVRDVVLELEVCLELVLGCGLRCISSWLVPPVERQFVTSSMVGIVTVPTAALAYRYRTPAAVSQVGE